MALNGEIYQTLSTPLQHLVDEIESAARFEIELRHRSERASTIGEAGDGKVGVVASHDHAFIEYNTSLDEITENDYAHELLHLRRFYVLGAPQLVSADFPRNANAAANIGNWLEHVFIYRDQLEISPSFRDQLRAQMLESWSAYPWKISNDNRTLRFHALIKYLITKLYGGDQETTQMRSALAKDKSLFKTRGAAQRTEKVLTKHHAYTASVFDFAEIPRDKFLLRYLFPREKRYELRCI